jgi:integrase
VLVRPKESTGHALWRARYADPDSGRIVWVSLDPLVVRTLEQRRDWAIRKSRALARRRMELEGGAPRTTGTSVEDGVSDYFKAHVHLRKRTVDWYKAATDKLVAWCSSAGAHSLDDITRARLIQFRDALVKQPKHSAERLGKRGAFKPGAERRSAHSVNRDLRSVGTVLRYLVDRDLLPRCTHDDLRRALKPMKAEREQVEYLRPHELQQLLQAALRHDAATFTATRDEHAGRRQAGGTLRYQAIAPFVATVLLTGARFAEVVELEWSQVDLDALGPDGARVGEIRLRGADTKTHHGRTIALEVSPALRALLAAMKLANDGGGPVFALTRGEAVAAAKRLLRVYGAPNSFSWQALRRTCGTFLTNAPGIFGAASAYRSAKQLGHSVTVAERHYVDIARGISRDARALEAAMQVESELRDVVARLEPASSRSVTLARVKRQLA